jgi:phosphoribosylaminoimidazolecarboxamide formyltransferase / IMP cyclohydrolase
VLRADPAYTPASAEIRREHGLELVQAPNRTHIGPALFERVVGARPLEPSAIMDLQLATIVAKHTPSNAVSIVYDGQAIGIGGGQQARIHATRSACEKSDLWRLQLHPRVMELIPAAEMPRTARFNLVRQWLLWDELSDEERAQLQAASRHLPSPPTREERSAWLATFAGVVMSSDGYIPFPDNAQRAARSFVHAIAQPGGSKQDSLVTEAADRARIAMVHTGLRLFWH